MLATVPCTRTLLPTADVGVAGMAVGGGASVAVGSLIGALVGVAVGLLATAVGVFVAEVAASAEEPTAGGGGGVVAAASAAPPVPMITRPNTAPATLLRMNATIYPLPLRCDDRIA